MIHRHLVVIHTNLVLVLGTVLVLDRLEDDRRPGQESSWKGCLLGASLPPMTASDFWSFLALLCFVAIPLALAHLYAPPRFKPLAVLESMTGAVGVAFPSKRWMLGIGAATVLAIPVSIVWGHKRSIDREARNRAKEEQREREEKAALAWKEKKQAMAEAAAREEEANRPAQEEARRIEMEARRKKEEEERRVMREIRADVLASAFTYDMTVVANREDGLVVREAAAEGKLFFVPHIAATKRLPIGREFSAKGWRRKLTYRLNDATVLEVITLAE